MCGSDDLIVANSFVAKCHISCSGLGAPALELGTVINNILLLSPRFDNLTFVFRPRGCNKVAHVLASPRCNHGFPLPFK